jgi:hypothetical protein
MNDLIHLFKELYAYCTDFIINLANITGLSYYEVNFFIFIIIYPLFFIITFTIYIIQKLRLRTIKNPTITITKIASKTSFNIFKTFNKKP